MYITVTKKKLLSLLLICSMLFAFAPKISPTVDIQAATNYQNWKQYDSQWGNLSVGNSTMARIGCKITSLAILMVHSGAEDASNFNPGVLRNRFVNGGFIGTYGDLADAAVEEPILHTSIMSVTAITLTLLFPESFLKLKAF